MESIAHSPGATSAPAAPSSTRYTLAGLPAAEARVGRDLAAVAAAVRDALPDATRVALVLVGSYARGEGGVVLDAHGEPGPHNDYDLVAIVSHGERSLRGLLEQVGARCSRTLGIDVDIWPIDRARLAHVPATLFWLDVALGGARVIDGDRDVLHALPAPAPRHVPLDECGRLLANRAIGLALSNLEHDAVDETVMARHGHKAVLACGDALLLAADRYAPTLRARRDALDALRGAPAIDGELVAAYAQSIAYRARPDAWRPDDGATLRAWYATTRARIAGWHLRFESWRIGSPTTPAGFARWRGRVFPHLPDVRPGGALVSALRARAAGATSFWPYLGHPRERLARVAVALGYGLDDPAARTLACDLLGIESMAHGPTVDSDTRAALRALVHRGG